ncbi:hypothetical protein, partial [Micromonospora sp. S-DT3-3-22]|uniref:hypothetical protein n=1 Tax=Micromonospora sp. S-DT3-3-22 TaxID=2755359 RepID=UPI001E3F93A8
MRRWAPELGDTWAAGAVAVSQALWWLAARPEPRLAPGVCAVAVVAVVALLYRRRVPGPALAGAALATALAAPVVGAAPAGPAAVLLTAYALVVHRTA